MQEILIATTADGRQVRYLLEVVGEGDHYASSLQRFAASGELETGNVAPRFYGVTAEQARRRMISVLENQYEDVSTQT